MISQPAGTEFNTSYSFNDKMEESITKMDENIVEEAAEEDYDSEGNLIFTPPAPKPPVEEESKAESVKATTPTTSGNVEEIEKIRQKAEEWKIKEEEDKKNFEENKKKEEKPKLKKPVRANPKLMGGNLNSKYKRKRRID